MILLAITVCGLTLVLVVEITVTLATGGRDRLGDAVGEYGRAVVGVLAKFGK
jgi:hypothetical protein